MDTKRVYNLKYNTKKNNGTQEEPDTESLCSRQSISDYIFAALDMFYFQVIRL